MTNAERLSLIHQLEILKTLGSNRHSDYDVYIEALERGYDEKVNELFAGFDEFSSAADRAEVRDILDMFRALSNSGSRLKFGGFDGNEETNHYSYARFLIDKENRWVESRIADPNSHREMLDSYRGMLREWHAAADEWHLTEEDLARIAKHAPFLCRREA